MSPIPKIPASRRLAEHGLAVAVRSGGHSFPGSAPATAACGRLAELPASAEIVAYCRGRYCVMSLEAVRLLRTHGYRARPMDGGLPEWRDEGMPVAAA